MVDVRFELTTNDPWSVDDAICEGFINSPLGYRRKYYLSPTQPKPYNTLRQRWLRSRFVTFKKSALYSAHVTPIYMHMPCLVYQVYRTGWTRRGRYVMRFLPQRTVQSPA